LFRRKKKGEDVSHLLVKGRGKGKNMKGKKNGSLSLPVKEERKKKEDQ